MRRSPSSPCASWSGVRGRLLLTEETSPISGGSAGNSEACPGTSDDQEWARSDASGVLSAPVQDDEVHIVHEVPTGPGQDGVVEVPGSGVGAQGPCFAQGLE